MLIPDFAIDRYRYRNILSIDPGTLTMGICVLQLDLHTLKFSFATTETLRLDKEVKRNARLENISDHLGNTTARLLAIEEILPRILTKYNIRDIVAEDAYSAINVSTYATLIECQVAIRKGLLKVSPELVLNLVKPSAAKKNVGVKGNSSDKSEVRAAVKERLLPYLDESINIDTISEHECDAIIIGYFYLKVLIETGAVVIH